MEIVLSVWFLITQQQNGLQDCQKPSHCSNQHCGISKCQAQLESLLRWTCIFEILNDLSSSWPYSKRYKLRCAFSMTMYFEPHGSEDKVWNLWRGPCLLAGASWVSKKLGKQLLVGGLKTPSTKTVRHNRYYKITTWTARSSACSLLKQ